MTKDQEDKYKPAKELKLSDTEIRAFAGSVSSHLGLNKTEDVFDIASSVGGSVHRMSTVGEMNYRDDKGHILVEEDGGFQIFVPGPSEISTEVERQMIAHELGHLFLHWEAGEAMSASFSGATMADLEADEFALAFLIPDQRLKPYMDRDASAVEISYDFGVTIAFAKRRMAAYQEDEQ